MTPKQEKTIVETFAIISSFIVAITLIINIVALAIALIIKSIVL